MNFCSKTGYVKMLCEVLKPATCSTHRTNKTKQGINCCMPKLQLFPPSYLVGITISTIKNILRNEFEFMNA